MKIASGEKWILCGASRGLGKSFSKLAEQQSLDVLSISRKAAVSFDFTQKDRWSEILQTMKSFGPTRLFYFAGGGPHGDYEKKQWKDHEWAFKLNFEFPAFLLHQMLAQPSLWQMTLVGSSIAESKPDPGAASYAAAKHGLRGLVTSLQAEQSRLDLRLFSPGYMDTALLPDHAWPRQQADLVRDTKDIAQTLWDWIQNGDDANKCLS